MPGYGNWKTLYEMEHSQLREEGYPVKDRGAYLPASAKGSSEEDITEAQWEEAYRNLWKVREQSIRPDFPFEEPDDYGEIVRAAAHPPTLQPLDDDEYVERIRGAWYGRCAGVVLGKPLELGLSQLEIRRYLESCGAYPLDDWVPYAPERLGRPMRCRASSLGHVRYVEPDDDIHYTVLGLLLVEQKGLDFTRLDVVDNWLRNLPYLWIWSCTRQAYYHAVNMTDDRPKDEQIAEFPTRLNPWREGINSAIRADFWGYIHPGDPRAAAATAYKEVSVNCVKNGIYGSLFVAGCLAAALSRNPTVDTILEGGLSVIPRMSRLARVVQDVTAWYAEEREWVPVCDKIYEKYGHLYPIHSLNNLAIVVLSLVHGQLDFTRTITTAVMCGLDTDCTGGTAGSIVGAAVGYDGIDPRWIEPFNDQVRTVVAGFGHGRISDLVDRTIDCYRKVHS